MAPFKQEMHPGNAIKGNPHTVLRTRVKLLGLQDGLLCGTVSSEGRWIPMAFLHAMEFCRITYSLKLPLLRFPALWLHGRHRNARLYIESSISNILGRVLQNRRLISVRGQN
jgi:hypothetical protein